MYVETLKKVQDIHPKQPNRTESYRGLGGGYCMKSYLLELDHPDANSIILPRLVDPARRYQGKPRENNANG